MSADNNGEEIYPTILVMLGATGDLAKRKLIPALYDLYVLDKLPPLLQVVGFAMDELSDDQFREHVREVIEEAREVDIKKCDEFCSRFVYETGKFEEAAAYKKLGERMGRQDNQWNLCTNKLFYIAASPVHYKTIFQSLHDSGLTEPCSVEEGWTRVIVEKPFGKDLATAQELDSLLSKLFKEEQIYRVDHYLGKDTVRNLLTFRFSNSFLEPAWNGKHIDHIQIQVLEEAGVEERGAFYDGIGALRDVGQNHMLQLLALTTMENPGDFSADAIRSERAALLEGLEAMDVQDVAMKTVRGQYEGYKDIEGVERDSTTETYFRLKTHLHAERWKGVPVHLEAGKRLGESKVEVAVRFRHQMPCLCPPGEHYRNELVYRVQPNEQITTSFWVKKPGPDMVTEQQDFVFDYEGIYGDDTFTDAYTKLLLDMFKGDQTLFVSTPEIEASWKFVDPIEQEWGKDVVPLLSYKPGTYGPEEKDVPPKGLPKKELGYIGLGKMGHNMVERLLEHEWSVVASDPNEEAQQAAAEAGADVVKSATEVVKTLRQAQGNPDKNILVWIMVPYQVVDDVLQEILPHLEEGDVVIDGGNSNYKETLRRAEELTSKKITFFDVGVSGGPAGARNGACLMVGGEQSDYKKWIGLFNDLAAPGGYDYMGKAGAGHFVKMVHNGIEYGMMQAIGEGFAIIKGWPFDAAQGQVEPLDLERVANLYNHASVIESRLVGWLKKAYEEYGVSLDDISGEVSHSGEGMWTVEAAKELGIPVPVIEGALQFRVDSEDNPSYTGQVVSALRNQFGGHEVKKE